MKLTSTQLRRIIREEVKRLSEGPEEDQQFFYNVLRQAEDALENIIRIVDKSGKGSSEEFGGQGSQQVNLKAVVTQIREQRKIEQDAPDYGGGLFDLPGNVSD